VQGITDLAKIIGNWYVDVANALDGKQQFKMAEADATYRPATSMANPIPSTSAAMSNPVPPSAAAPSVQSTTVPSTMPRSSKVAGQKRKKTPDVNGDVIDLTGDSP